MPAYANDLPIWVGIFTKATPQGKAFNRHK